MAITDEDALFGLPPDASEDKDMQELALDGEIMGDEVDPLIMMQNEMEKKAKHVLQQQALMK